MKPGDVCEWTRVEELTRLSGNVLESGTNNKWAGTRMIQEAEPRAQKTRSKETQIKKAGLRKPGAGSGNPGLDRTCFVCLVKYPVGIEMAAA